MLSKQRFAALSSSANFSRVFVSFKTEVHCTFFFVKVIQLLVVLFAISTETDLCNSFQDGGNDQMGGRFGFSGRRF